MRSRVGLPAAAAVVLAGVGTIAATDPRGVLFGLADTGGRVVFWGLVLVAGARLAGRLVGSRLTGIAHLTWDGAAGTALVAAILLLVGLLPGGFRGMTVRLALGVILAAGAVLARTDPIRRFRRDSFADASAPALALLLALVTVSGLLWNRVPPVFFDSRAYHFALPEMWLVDGRIAPVSWSLHSWFPPAMSVLYGAGLACGGERLANDANLLVGLCLIAGAFDLGRRLFGTGGGALSSVLVTTLPLILYALAIPAADLGHGTFAFGTLACLLLRSDGDPSWPRRAGLLCGGALLTKYLGFLSPLALGIGWLAFGDARSRFTGAARFAAMALSMSLPWLAANAWTVGNPVAPAAASTFSTKGLSPGGAESFRGDARGGLPSSADLARMVPRWITGDEDDARFYPTPAWGWLPLILLPVAVVGARVDRSIRAMLALAGAQIAIWFLTYRWERFLIAAGTLTCVALAGGIVVLSRRVRPLRLLPAAVGVAALLAAASSFAAIARFDGGGSVALGRETAEEFIARGLPSARLFARASAALDPTRDRILLVGEMRHYGLRVPRSAPTGFNVHPLAEALRSDERPESASRVLRAAGFTHLIVDRAWTARSAAQYPSLGMFRERPEILDRYLASLGEPLAIDGPIALFRIPG